MNRMPLLPRAPSIGGDAYAVGAWLRECEAELRRRSPRSPGGLMREAEAVTELAEQFEEANPEVRRAEAGS